MDREKNDSFTKKIYFLYIIYYLLFIIYYLLFIIYLLLNITM